jgi:Subtilase family
MVIEAADRHGSFTDIDEAAAIVYAVDHEARIINFTRAARRRPRWNAVRSTTPSPKARCWSQSRRREPGRVPGRTAAARRLARASFSNTGTHISLAAPGEAVFGAVSAASAESRYPRVSLPGSATGLYGYASGTSFAAPQVAGAAALVWAANVAGPRRRRELPRRGRPERRRRASSHPGRHPHERLLRPCEGPHLPLHGRRTGRGRLAARGVAALDGVVAAGSSLALRLRRARCARRGSAGVRRCARSRGRSRRRSRSSRCPRRRAQRSASPCPRGCPGSSGARRRGARGL